MTYPARHGAILIVDDEPMILATFKQFLESSLNISVTTASGPVEALEIIRERPVHLILADYRMPAMNGVEFLQEARRRYPGVHLIMMSAFETLLHEDMAALGLDATLMKPLDPRVLVHTIRETLVAAD